MTKPSDQMHPVHAALSHRTTERTPLFEIFQPFHPIHWKICGRNIVTDMAMAWDAMADGIAWEELVEAEIKAEYAVRKFFGLDMVRLNGVPPRNFTRPVKTGKNKWKLDGTAYHLNERIFMVELENPAEAMSDSNKISEDETRRAKGGHILHASHSVHEDVKTDNYFAVVNAYRKYFDMEPLQI